MSTLVNFFGIFEKKSNSTVSPGFFHKGSIWLLSSKAKVQWTMMTLLKQQFVILAVFKSNAQKSKPCCRPSNIWKHELFLTVGDSGLLPLDTNSCFLAWKMELLETRQIENSRVFVVWQKNLRPFFENFFVLFTFVSWIDNWILSSCSVVDSWKQKF